MDMTQKNQARGYIASGEFRGNRSPQNIQNQTIKLYCDSQNLEFVMSRAEYWFNGSTDCQLWAALKEGFKHIVFFSIWQLPPEKTKRFRIYDYCVTNMITLHFASERLYFDKEGATWSDIETLIRIYEQVTEDIDHKSHIRTLKNLI